MHARLARSVFGRMRDLVVECPEFSGPHERCFAFGRERASPGAFQDQVIPVSDPVVRTCVDVRKHLLAGQERYERRAAEFTARSFRNRFAKSQGGREFARRRSDPAFMNVVRVFRSGR